MAKRGNRIYGRKMDNRMIEFEKRYDEFVETMQEVQKNYAQDLDELKERIRSLEDRFRKQKHALMVVQEKDFKFMRKLLGQEEE